ncbi:MAG: MFS transporter [Acidobacteria bacterium]|nr:MFS transporter [Acidobacteriota bacterium]
MTKWRIVGFFWGAQVITEVIRISLAVAAPTLMRLYDISPSAMGYVLSGWNWGYTGSLLLLGVLVDRFGPWITMGIGSGVWGMATFALPIASGPVSLFSMRALFGIGHSVRHSAQAASISRWFGREEVATAVGICFSGIMVGLAVGSMISAFILEKWGWQWVFYCIGGSSLVLTLLWFAFYPDKKIGRQAGSSEGSKEGTGTLARWLLLLRHRSVWGIAFGQMGYLYAHFFFVTWLPGYLILERKMTVLRTGMVASLPFWMGLVGTVAGGWIGDYLIRRGHSRTLSRKLMIGGGLTLATIMVVAAAFASQAWLAVTFLTLCMGCMRLTTGSLNAAPIDLAPPDLVGSLTSLQNFVGTISGILAAIVTGYIVQGTGSFVLALVVAGAVAMCGAISYVFIVRRFEPLEMTLEDAAGTGVGKATEATLKP